METDSDCACTVAEWQQFFKTYSVQWFGSSAMDLLSGQRLKITSIILLSLVYNRLQLIPFYTGITAYMQVL